MDNSSSFGQFRIPKFVQSDLQPGLTPTPTPSNHEQTRMGDTDREELSQNFDRGSMFQSASHRPLEHATSATPSNVVPTEQSRSPASTGRPPNIELAESIESPSPLVLTRQLGPNRDGRVRNPVPNKLKGKTDTKNGNFGVMHMGLALAKKNESPSRDTAAERGAAAQRTSENTASRARAAQQEKYVPPRKRATTAAMDDVPPRVMDGSRSFGRIGLSDVHKPRGRALAPDEVKQEQARLLTLLRSITPLKVVDQLCTAVAYFGGIPSAPPPEDGIFPESANTRESGALFIGWLAEIFPIVNGPSEVFRPPEPPKVPTIPTVPEPSPISVTPQLSEPSRASEVSVRAKSPPQATGISEISQVSGPQQPVKRGRGRPRKNAQAPTPAVLAPPAPPAPQAGSVPAMTGSNGAQYNASGPPSTWNASNSATSAASYNSSNGLEAAATRNSNVEDREAGNTQLQSTAAATSKRPEPDSTNTSTTKKGRGRPKGSKNKNKNAVSEKENPVVPSDLADSGAVTDQISRSAQPSAQQLHRSQSQGAPPQHSQPQPGMTDPGRKPTQPHINATSTAESSSLNYPKPLWENEPWGKKPAPAAANTQLDDLSAAERAILEAFRSQKSTHALNVSALNQASTGTSSVNSLKRKRPSTSQLHLDPPAATNPPAEYAPQIASGTPVGTKVVAQDSQNNLNQTNLAQDHSALQWSSSSGSTLTAPSVKRQRKPKQPTQSTPTLGPTTSRPNNISPPSVQGTIPDSTSDASKQGITGSRPRAEGLEAHYERFASLQQQNEQSRNRTPTIPQPHQQQHRPQYQAVQSPPRPATQQQIHRQFQQSQRQSSEVHKASTAAQQRLPQQAPQNDRNDSKNAAKSSSGRTSSNFYSNQSSTYKQQYPSNQSTQQYVAQQASPPLNRASTTQPIGGAGTQFAHSEHVYRTDSPHSGDPQSSPVFSQAEAYKANHPHPVANTSPSYPQANKYRMTSMHNLPQQSAAAFSTTRQPQTTTHPQASQTASYSNNPPYDPTYVDLPTLEQLGHTEVGAYGLGVGVGGASRAGSSSTGGYGPASSLSNAAFDSGASNLLQAGSRPGSNATYRTSSGIGGNSYRDRTARS